MRRAGIESVTQTQRARIGVGVVGLGMIGRLHARIVDEHPRLHLAAAYDPDPEAMAWGAQAFGCAVAESVDALVDRRDVEAVLVCSPEYAHLAPVRAALERGKPTLVEKPLATTVEDARTMVALADASDGLLLPGHVLRFDARYDYAKKALQEGRLGPLQHLFARRSNPSRAARRVQGRVSLVYYLGIHDIDIALWLAGRPVERVYAQRTVGLHSDLGIEDSMFSLLTFRGGVVASLEFSWSLPEHLGARIYGGLDVVGRHGMVRVDLLAPAITEIDGRGPNLIDPVAWPEVRGRIRGALADQVDHFARCLLDGETPAITPREAANAVLVADAILRSAASGTVVTVPDPFPTDPILPKGGTRE